MCFNVFSIPTCGTQSEDHLRQRGRGLTTIASVDVVSVMALSMKAPRITRWTAEFPDRETERAFRLETWRDTVRQVRLVLVIAALAFLAFLYPDYLVLGPGSRFYLMLAVRCFLLVVLLGIFWASTRESRIELLDRAVVAGAFSGMLVMTISVALRPDHHHSSMTTIIVVLGIYLFFFNNRFIYIAVVGMVGSLIYIVVASIAHRPEIPELIVLSMSFALVNLLCFGAVNHLNRLRRLAHASLIYHQHLEGELRASETQYRELVEGANSVILRFDTKGIIRFINNYGLRFFGFEADELIGQNIMGTIAPRTEQWEGALEAMMQDVQQHPEKYLLAEAENVRKNGERIWLTWSIRPILDQKGELAEILSVGHDISQRKELETELRKLATTDSLTGIANRRRFLSKAPKEVTRSQRYGRDLSVLMLDVDHFKTINDRYGHAVGDQVLCRLVEVCNDELREHDVIGRLGGEEFAILLPETVLETARAVAERLRENIEATTVDGQSFHFTVSFGVAQVKGSEETAEEVIRRADEALYRAKQKGRNRVEVSS